MFIRVKKIKTKARNYRTLYLVESKRVNGTVKQINLGYLGSFYMKKGKPVIPVSNFNKRKYKINYEDHNLKGWFAAEEEYNYDFWFNLEKRLRELKNKNPRIDENDVLIKIKDIVKKR